MQKRTFYRERVEDVFFWVLIIIAFVVIGFVLWLRWT